MLFKRKKNKNKSRMATVYAQDVGDDADRPAVHGFAVGFLSQHFRGCKKKKKKKKNSEKALIQSA